MIEIHLILLFMIAAAVIAVWVKDLLSSVVAVGAVGIGLSMAFLIMKAPDLAMMQLVVEILSLILLVRATIRKDLPFSTSGRWFFNTFATAIFLAVFFGFAHMAIREMPALGSPLLRASGMYLDSIKANGSDTNLVSAITLELRALDILGEATVLFAAIVGVLAVARKITRQKGV